MGRHAANRSGGPVRRLPYGLLALAGLGMTVTGAITLGDSLAAQGRTHTNQASDTTAPPADVDTGSPAPATGSVPTAPASTQSAAAPAAPAQPVRLVIAAIHVDAPVGELGLTSAGQLAAPTSMTGVGWYSGSSTPGTAGPAVFAGHRDSATGPAVFMNLDRLVAGDVVSVVLDTGATVDYRVTASRSYAATQFPTSSVYGALPDSELRLITCAGALVDGRYVDNLVVFAQRQGS